MGIFKKIKDGIENMKRKYKKNPLQKRVSDFNKNLKKVMKHDEQYHTNYAERFKKRVSDYAEDQGTPVKYTGKGKLSVTGLSEDILKIFEDQLSDPKEFIKEQEQYDKTLALQAKAEAEMHKAESEFEFWYNQDLNKTSVILKSDPEFLSILRTMGSNWHYGRAPSEDITRATEIIKGGLEDLEDF